MKITATDAQVALYAARIRAGSPTGKVFGAPMSEVDFSEEQRAVIREARVSWKVAGKAEKRRLIRAISRGRFSQKELDLLKRRLTLMKSLKEKKRQEKISAKDPKKKKVKRIWVRFVQGGAPGLVQQRR